MQLITRELVDAYLENDEIAVIMDVLSHNDNRAYQSQRWLRESAPKRFLFQQLYGDLLRPSMPCLRVLDVGGGITCFTSKLARLHDYKLVDLLAHENISICQQLENSVGHNFVHPVDWNSFDGDAYDLIIANDIFPNVDQRLDAFIKRFLPKCKMMRLSLTWHEVPRAYKTKRVDGDEILFMLSWDLNQLTRVLQKYADRIIEYSPDAFNTQQTSLYANDRQVGIVEFQGDLAKG